jgi:hypothetical protein
LCTFPDNGSFRRYSKGPLGQFRSEPNVYGGEGDAISWTVVRAGEAGGSGGVGGGGDGGDAALAPPGELAAVLEARGEHAAALPHAVSELVKMGFAEADVRAALAASGNLPQQALERLLGT